MKLWIALGVVLFAGCLLEPEKGQVITVDGRDCPIDFLLDTAKACSVVVDTFSDPRPPGL